MLKVFATQVVISRGYDNKPAISITRGNDSAASVRFRIGKRVYDPKAENNTRWLNYSVAVETVYHWLRQNEEYGMKVVFSCVDSGIYDLIMGELNSRWVAYYDVDNYDQIVRIMDGDL